MSLALQGKTNYLFGFQENMFILLILCALKGQGHEFPENVTEGCPPLLKTSLMWLSLKFCFFFLASRGGHKIEGERKSQHYIVTKWSCNLLMQLFIKS
jgi:hypothetical protein